METLAKALDEISPGFRFDKDELWVTHLAIEKQSQIRRWREDYQELMELYDEEKQNVTAARKEKSASLPLLKEQLKEKKKEVEQMLRKLVIDLKKLKTEADKIRDDELRTDNLVNDAKRRRSIDLDEIDFTDKNVDFVPDDDYDYLPWSETISKRPAEPPKPANKRPRADEFTVPTPKVPLPKGPAVDELLENVPTADAEILKDLKALIKKYDCRDRVLDAIESTREKDHVSKKVGCLMEEVSQHKRASKSQ